MRCRLSFGILPIDYAANLAVSLLERRLVSPANQTNIMSNVNVTNNVEVSPKPEVLQPFKYKQPVQRIADFLNEITSRPIPKDGHILTDAEVNLARDGYKLCHAAKNKDGSLKRESGNPQTYSKVYDDILCHGFKFRDYSREGNGYVHYTCTIKVMKTRIKAYVTRSESAPF